MRILILLAVVRFVAAGNVYQQPLTRVDSRKTKMIRNGTWDAYLKDKQLLQQTFNATSLKDFDELEYVACIFIGNPPQPFYVHYDLFSSDFWIPDVKCGTVDSPTPYCPDFCSKPGGALFCNPKCQPGSTAPSTSTKETCDQKWKYDSWKSGTFSPVIIPRDINLDYEFGYITASNLGRDEIHLDKRYQQNGTLTVFSFFSQTKELSPAFKDVPFDGIMALTPGSHFISSLRDMNILDKKLFTIYMSDQKYAGGLITFGGIDVEHCSSEVNYQSRRQSIYEFLVRNITYGSIIVQDIATLYLDMSRTSIYGPADEIQKIKEAAGASEDGTIACDAKVQDITFGDETAANIFTIPAKNLIIHNSDGSCNLAVAALPPQSTQWIFGTPWFRSYCNVFTFENNDEKIGFAKVIT